MSDEHSRTDEDERTAGRLASLSADGDDAAPLLDAADVAETSTLPPTSGEFVPPATTPEPTLGALVTALVRRTPDALLAACVVVGLVGAAAIAVAAPAWWRTIAPLILLSTFGAWGIADRERDAVGARAPASPSSEAS